MHNCSKCGETDSTKFYRHKKTMCGNCHNEYTKQLGKQKRLYAVSALGSKCLSCGYNKYLESLDIHHTDPSIKDENFASMRGWSLKRIDEEIKGCVLLCKNCHSAFHAGHPVIW